MNDYLLHSTDVAKSASELFVDTMQATLQEHKTFRVVLSGGSTPLKMYEHLIGQKDLAWHKVLFFFGDDRFVPHDHPDSNYKAAKEKLLEPLAIPVKNIFPWPYGQSLENAAADYATTLTTTLGNTSPLFDLTFLGLGDDAHTASLFPNTGAVLSKGLTTTCHPKTVKYDRLTLTSETISKSRTVVFLVSGESKRKALRETRAGKGDFDTYPARSIKATETLYWLTDIAF
ncbi:MAG: 6-phosphogluconolactonase [Trueperaceae bacterium]